MNDLKSQVLEYAQVKEDLKKLMDRKKNLEQIICTAMDENEISTLELPNGTNLNYKVKDSLAFSKEKSKETRTRVSRPSRSKNQEED